MATTITPTADAYGLGAKSDVPFTSKGRRTLVPFTQVTRTDGITPVSGNAPATTHLGMVTGAHGTAAASLRSIDSKAATATRTARFQVLVPDDFAGNGETLQFVVNAGMVTTVSDTTATLELDVRNGGTGSDIGPAAQSINSLTAADYTFAVTTTAVDAGEILDVEINVAIEDGATATAVIAAINSIELRT